MRIAPNAKCQRVLILALRLVLFVQLHDWQQAVAQIFEAKVEAMILASSQGQSGGLWSHGLNIFGNQ